MDDQRFDEIRALAKEQPGVEFKSGGSSADKAHFARVVRAAVAMSNRRDGGVVVIGVDDDGESLTFSGVEHGHLTSWNYDDVADRLAIYADPSLDFDLELFERDGRTFVVLEIREFADVPVICKKGYPDVLRDGACYVRTRRKPESVEIPRHVEMRDLLDLAIEKGVRAFLERSRRAGIPLAPAEEAAANDAELFSEELGDLP